LPGRREERAVPHGKILNDSPLPASPEILGIFNVILAWRRQKEEAKRNGKGQTGDKNKLKIQSR
jgi:hypothetical protein